MISVYHLVSTAEPSIAQAQLDWQLRKYQLVADVLTDSLEQARKLTQHWDGSEDRDYPQADRPWWHSADVTRRFTGVICRSTRAGDLMVSDDGPFLLTPDGFAPIQLPEQITGRRLDNIEPAAGVP